MATFELIEDFVKRAEKAEKAGTLLLVDEKVLFINKTDETDTFNTLEEAFEQGKDLSKYEKKVSKNSFKAELNKTFTSKEIDLIKRFYTITELLSGKNVEIVVDPNEAFNKEYRAISAKIAKATDEEKKAALSAERDALFAKYGKTKKRKQ